MSVKVCACCTIVIVLYVVFFQMLFKYKLRKLDFRDHLTQEERECKIMVAVNREKISRYVESQWLYYLRFIKEKGKSY
jgi:hypothetical protein